MYVSSSATGVKGVIEDINANVSNTGLLVAILVFLLLTFFVAIGVLYMTMKNQSSSNVSRVQSGGHVEMSNEQALKANDTNRGA